jgi:hypothetical protein
MSFGGTGVPIIKVSDISFPAIMIPNFFRKKKTCVSAVTSIDHKFSIQEWF